MWLRLFYLFVLFLAVTLLKRVLALPNFDKNQKRVQTLPFIILFLICINAVINGSAYYDVPNPTDFSLLVLVLSGHFHFIIDDIKKRRTA